MSCTDPEILSYLDFSCKYFLSSSFFFIVVSPLKSAHLSFSWSVKRTPGPPDFELSPPSPTHEQNLGAAVASAPPGGRRTRPSQSSEHLMMRTSVTGVYRVHKGYTSGKHLAFTGFLHGPIRGTCMVLQGTCLMHTQYLWGYIQG